MGQAAPAFGQRALPNPGRDKESQRKELERRIQSLETQLRVTRSQLEKLETSEPNVESIRQAGVPASQAKTEKAQTEKIVNPSEGTASEKKSFWGRAASK